jgi:hemolysin III
VVLAFPAAFLLWRRAEADTARRLAVLIYGLSLAFCYSASSLIHGLPQPREALGAFDRLDRIGIFVLIAGTYTPVASSRLRGRGQAATRASSG